MPYPGQLPKALQKGKNRHKDKVISAPETADEFLAAGVNEEEGGDKWRAGDAAKAARFYQRAIKLYEQGLHRFSTSFDLAYNKARLLYQFAQDPKLSASRTGLLSTLETALDANRRALALDTENADALFNLAQLLATLAETLDNSLDDSAPSKDAQRPINLVEEALKLFQICFAIQETAYREHRDYLAQSTTQPEHSNQHSGDETGRVTESGSSEEQWISVVEPITASMLAETIVATIETLITFCGLSAASATSHRQAINEGGHSLIRQLDGYRDELENGTNAEAELACARFLAASACLELRAGSIDSTLCKLRTKAAFEESQLSTTKSSPIYPALLCAYADALVTVNSTIADRQGDQNSRWKILTQALDLLTEASQRPSSQDLVAIHIGRGDVELLRLTLCCSADGRGYSELLDTRLVALAKTSTQGVETGIPDCTDLPASLNTPQTRRKLLMNAIIYYRGAVAVARSDAYRDETTRLPEALVKSAIADCLKSGNNNHLISLQRDSIDSAEINTILQDVVNEGLVMQTAVASLIGEKVDI